MSQTKMIGRVVGLSVLVVASTLPPALTPAMAQPATITHALLAPSLGTSGSGIQATHGGWRASQLVGASVYDDANENLGTIDNLVVGPDGRIRDVVLSVGGFLGLGSKLVAIPFDHLAFAKINAGPDATAISPKIAPVPPNVANDGASEEARRGAEPPASQSTYVMVPGVTKSALAEMPAFSYRG